MKQDAFEITYHFAILVLSVFFGYIVVDDWYSTFWLERIFGIVSVCIGFFGSLSLLIDDFIIIYKKKHGKKRNDRTDRD